MIFLDFICNNNHVSEELVTSDTKELDCPTCGETAIRQVSAPRAVLEGVSGDFPGAAMKWEKQHSASNYKDEQ